MKNEKLLSTLTELLAQANDVTNMVVRLSEDQREALHESVTLISKLDEVDTQAIMRTTDNQDLFTVEYTHGPDGIVLKCKPYTVPWSTDEFDYGWIMELAHEIKANAEDHPNDYISKFAMQWAHKLYARATTEPPVVKPELAAWVRWGEFDGDTKLAWEPGFDLWNDKYKREDGYPLDIPLYAHPKK